MDNWEVMRKVRKHLQGMEYWRALDAVWALLDGFITRAEALALLSGLADDPEALLEEVGACGS